MQTQKPSGNIEIEELFNWLEQQPELEDIRTQAATTVCEYRPGESSTSARIQCNSAKELATGRKGFVVRHQNSSTMLLTNAHVVEGSMR